MERKEDQIIMPPSGLSSINATFGNIGDYVTIQPDGSKTLDPQFESKYIVTANLPFTIPLAWNEHIKIFQIRCHRLLREHFEAVFQKILDRGLRDKIQSYGGCFRFRQKRNRAELSAHSWGIAIDINPGSNRQGTRGDMDEDIASIFKDAGFTWGGEWAGNRCDPMHFQFCKGY
jgi:hypothetical protein